MGFLLALTLSFLASLAYAWVVYWIDRYEKEPKMLLGGVFLWGALVAAGGAFLINTVLGVGVYFLTGSETATDLTTGSVIAPLAEESLKGLAVLVVFFAFRREFDSWVDGLVYAGVVALGFAATENTYYIYQYGFVEKGMQGLWDMALLRLILIGWQHPFYTAFTGLGLATARLSRSGMVRFFAPILGWTLAVMTHSVHNTLASLLSGPEGLIFGSLVDWSGWAFMGLIILWALRRERIWLRENLRDEVARGVISEAQYRTACSTWAQTAARVNALLRGNYHATVRFYQVCAELAWKKAQRARLGEEDGNSATITRLRDELATLSSRLT